MAKFALRAIRAKASNVQRTGSIPHVLIATIRPMLAKAPPIPHTLPPLGIRIHMLIYTLLIRTLPIFRKEPAFGHLFQVVFVQELAGFAFFAEAAEPVFAHDALFRPDVLVGAVVSSKADALLKILADIGNNGVTVLRSTVINSHGLTNKRLKVKFPTFLHYSPKEVVVIIPLVVILIINESKTRLTKDNR